MFQRRDKIPINNETYMEDVQFEFKLIKWLFKPIGIWALITVEKSSFDLLLSILSRLFCFVVFLFVLVPTIFHIVFIEKDAKVAIVVCGPLGFISGSFLKYICIIFHKNNIKHCFKCMEDDWKNIESKSLFREIMLNNAKVAHKITGYSTSFMYFAGLSYHIVLPLSQGEIFLEAENITVRPLVYPGLQLFFDPQISPIHEIVFTIHCICAALAYNMTSAACAIAAYVVLHISGQAQILFLKINDFVDIGGKNGNISDIVEHHDKMLRMAKYVRQILQEICFIELFSSVCMTCLAEYYCITEWENSNTVGIAVYICIFIFININIFMFCYIGELLINESTSIGTGAFDTNWYKLPSNKVLDLKMVILRSMRLPTLTAGNIANLSISTFASVLKTSVAYLNLLRSVTT